tara:strand:- start:86101 stop:87075 length:975 start_codon:yes stop_codon:yes gene_type:complete
MKFLKSFFSSKQKENLDKGLSKTKSSFFSKLSRSIAGKSKIDDNVLENLEDVLITSDVGVETSNKIVSSIIKRVRKEKYLNTSELDNILKDEILNIIHKSSSEENLEILPDSKLNIILVVGVNGVGKTTTIGKLANFYKNINKKVLLGAADTFRAGAIDQLKIWAKRANVEIVHKEMGSDPASVAYQTIQYGVSNNHDVIIIDTAGRLHNKINLMNELSKIKRVINNTASNCVVDVTLVIDGSTGQNAFEQAKQFSETTIVNSLVVTKLDGSARGGVVIGISDQLKIPIKFVCLGESIEDLQVFDKKIFIDSLFNNWKSEDKVS